ncbi:WD40 repeat-like protein [Lentinus brumalis]|uniref:WD40 repeat-like protein n=1 Tax=Lentinus brumalis TaxID=2498619 RepID=A0A371DFK9_9APHY|nr:WD40 repeat-like protein [Polyporus brumalis]
MESQIAKRKYAKQATLVNGHTSGITALAFSPGGTYLASAALDGCVCIWDVEASRLLHRYEGDSAVLCLAWVPSGEATVIFGTRKGNIEMLTISVALNDFSMRGFWAHDYPVETIAAKGNLVASGALGELKVWQWLDLEATFAPARELPEPPKTSHNEHQEVLVTSIHWTGTLERPQLMVTYMYHGVQLYDATTWQSIRTLSFQGKIASASLSEDGEHLAVSNLAQGFDVYRTDTGQPVGTFRHTVGKPQPTPVLFIHGGRAIVGGSTVGTVHVWDLDQGGRFPLHIPNEAPVLAIAGHYQPQQDQPYRFRIATGTFKEGTDCACIIWEATQAPPRDPELRTLEASTLIEDAVQPDKSSRTCGCIIDAVNSWLCWSVLIVCIVAYAIASVPGLEERSG